MDFITGLIGAVGPYVHEYGYAAVFVVLFLESFGVPLPGETMLVSAVLLASRGELQILPLAAAAYVAAVMGDNFGYLIGRVGGHALVERLGGRVGLTSERLSKVEGFFARFGSGIVMFARFFNILRQLNGVVAGTMEMPWWRFLAYNAVGGLLWVGVWTAGPYYLGHEMHRVLPFLLAHWMPLVLTAAALAAGGGYWVLRRRARHP